MSLGTFRGPTSAKGTRRYSAWPPAKPPVKCEYPKMPAGEWPMIFAAVAAFGFELSQQENNPFLQKKHSPQLIVNGTTTLSPTFKLLTAEPTSTTSPIGSWPSTSPFSIVGI